MIRYISKLDCFVKYPAALILILCACIAVLASTGKTPNFGWMGAHDIYTITVFETGIPVFRPWIAVEKFENLLTGDVWFSENIGYAFFSTWVVYFLYTKSREASSTYLFYILICPLFIVMYYSAWGGSIYDVIFGLSLVKSIEYLTKPSRELSFKSLVYASIWLAVLDLARPFSIALVIVFSGIWFIKIKFKFVIPFVIMFFLVFPFHFNQYKNFGGIVLSTYGGMNLREVFPLSSRDCNAEFSRNKIDTAEFSQCAGSVRSEVLLNLKSNPYLVLQAFSVERIARIMFPNPYWHGTGVLNHNSVGVQLKIFIYQISLAMFYFFFIKILSLRFSMLLCFFALLFVNFFTCISHNLTELPRIIMPNVLLIFYAILSSGVLPLKKLNSILRERTC